MVYELIKDAADRKGVTISKVESECKLSNGTIGKWKNSKYAPRMDSVCKVAKYLKIPMGKIVDAVLRTKDVE